MSQRDVFLISYVPGPAWEQGKSSTQQLGWPEHADYLNSVNCHHRLLIGGPLHDYSHIYLAIEAETAEEVQRIISADPWQQNRMLLSDRIVKWDLLVDPR